jgi:HEAT repeat protein
MREAALDSVATWLPGVPEFEAIVLAVLEKERAGGVRRAAVRALKGYASDVSLDALLEALEDHATMHAAGEALGGSKNPRAVDRMFERLQKAIAGSMVKATSKTDPDKQGKIAATLLEALGEFKDARIVAAGRELIGRTKNTRLGALAAQAMLKSSGKDDLRFVADLLEKDDEDYFPPAVNAAMLLEPAETFERLIAPFRADDRSSKLGHQRLDAVVDGDFVPTGDGWVKALLAVLKDVVKEGVKGKGNVETHVSVIRFLARTKDSRATTPFLELFDAQKDNERIVLALASAFQDLGDKRALPALIERLKSRRSTGWRIYRAIEYLADESTVDKVREIAAGKNDYTATYLLRRLEEKFPGA